MGVLDTQIRVPDIKDAGVGGNGGITGARYAELVVVVDRQGTKLDRWGVHGVLSSRPRGSHRPVHELYVS